MTDIELLETCLLAFEAIPTSTASRKMLKKLGKVPGAYAGNGSHILAHQMVLMLCERLNRESAPSSAMRAK